MRDTLFPVPLKNTLTITEQRPCYAIGYYTPNDYYRRYINGDLERKSTFNGRFNNCPENKL